MKLELVLDEVDLPWSPGPDWTGRMEALVASVSDPGAVLQVVLTDDDVLQEHNREYRGIDRPTDVLSFSYLEGHESDADALLPAGSGLQDYLDPSSPDGEPPLAGQVLVSVPTVVSRGALHTEDLEGEMAFMVVHGLLHVLGFDHHDDASAAIMRRREAELMERGGLSAPRYEEQD